MQIAPVTITQFPLYECSSESFIITIDNYSQGWEERSLYKISSKTRGLVKWFDKLSYGNTWFIQVSTAQNTQSILESQ